MELLISNVLVDSNIGHDEFVLKNKMLKEYDDTKGKNKLINLYGIKCSMFTKNSDIKIKREIEVKINLY